MTFINSVRGMHDVLPPVSAKWQRFETIVAIIMQQCWFQQIRTPIVEDASLYHRAVGEVTDIVEKEMYEFDDGTYRLALRPEGTAGVVRAAIEHNLLYNGPMKVWYNGPMFRRERPQKGRYRQFHQIGAESLGYAGPETDAEMILLSAKIFKDAGIKAKLKINDLGTTVERQSYRTALVDYFKVVGGLDADSVRRLESNPLRILDSKNPAMQDIIAGAPRLCDFMGAESTSKFQCVLSALTACGLEFELDDRLVRGLDYYNGTVFEWAVDGLTIAGGGRYDGLFEQLGGTSTPCVGFGIGVERCAELMPDVSSSPKFYTIATTEITSGMVKLMNDLRNLGHTVQFNGAGGSIKSQLKKANAVGAEIVLIFGEDELSSGQVTVKCMATGSQSTMPHRRLLDSFQPCNN